MVVVAWIIAVWLVSLVAFVALRAYGTRGSHRRLRPPGHAAHLPPQRQRSASEPRVSDRH